MISETFKRLRQLEDEITFYESQSWRKLSEFVDTIVKSGLMFPEENRKEQDLQRIKEIKNTLVYIVRKYEHPEWFKNEK